jgi:hypothetical protein
MDSLARPALGVSRLPEIPQSIVDEFLAEVQRDDLEIETHTHSGVFAGVEWLMPTAIVVYIVRPYFQAMLSELGKDHYKILKRASIGLYSRLMPLKISRIATAGKVVKDPRYSLIFSIVAAPVEDMAIKFLIQANLNEEDAAIAFDAYFGLIASSKDGTITPETLDRLEQGLAVGHTLLVAYDFSSGEIVPVDPRVPIDE